jgi:quinol monooxygenase YgiN
VASSELPPLKAIDHPKQKEAFMFVRLWYLNVSPEHAGAVKQLFQDEIIPTVRYYKGHLECDLLEPVNSNDEMIALSIWRRQSDALVYESSDLYEEQREKVLALVTKVPVLKTYTYEPVDALVY